MKTSEEACTKMEDFCSSSFEEKSDVYDRVDSVSSPRVVRDSVGTCNQSRFKNARPKSLKKNKLWEMEQSVTSCRKSVICSVKDFVNVTESRNIEDTEHSSSGRSSFSEDSDFDMKPLQRVNCNEEPVYTPSVDPSDIECIVTDTSSDESCEKDEDEHDISKLRMIDSKLCKDKFLCCLCEYKVQSGEGLIQLLQHLHSSHKFAVRGAVLTNPTSELGGQVTTQIISSKYSRQIKGYLCNRSYGGCGSTFPSKETLRSHQTVSKSAGSSCWLASGTGEKPLTVHSCSSCSYECSLRREMIQHLESCCDSATELEKEMNALTLGCRICANKFWTVSERSRHEVSVHSNEVVKLLMKCYACSDSFSSKVCLNKHVRLNHSDKEQLMGNVGFRCQLCYITFPSFKLIEEHFCKFHSPDLVYRCQKCSTILKTKRTYKVHLKSTQCGSVRHECPLCKKVLWSKRALSIHHRMKHFSSSSHSGFSCRICKQRFSSKLERKQHYSSDHQGDSLFNCTVCNKGFASKSGMYGHRQTHIKTDLSKCEFCGKEFSRRDSYNEHLLIHTGPRHKCPHCEKEFVQRSNLVRHIRIHTGEKPYKCSYCDKTFSDKGACNSHIRVHTREEACGCPYCGQVFSKKQKLKYHVRKHTGEGLVSCEFCAKTFTNSHSLKEHRMIHDHRTQILCVQCGKAFSTSKYLQRHIAMVHEATLMYNCPLCSRNFSQQARLKAHLMTHSGIKHLRCLLCTKAYASRKSLRHHLLSMHSITIEHRDYKQCFYAMTPEEAGLTIPIETPAFIPKLESMTTDSISEDRGSSSEEDESSDGPPQLERQEPLNSSVLHRSPFSSVRTKAARKELPFNINLSQEKIVKIKKNLGNRSMFVSKKAKRTSNGKSSHKISVSADPAQKQISQERNASSVRDIQNVYSSDSTESSESQS